MTVTEIVARAAQILVALSGAYLVALWFVLVVWTYRDIEARSHNVVTQVFSTLLVVLFFVPGVLLYMILRPKETLDQAFQRSLEEEYLLQDLEELPLCPSCHRYVEDDYRLCPHCHAQLREPCLACARLVDLRWPLCPYCAAPQDGREVEDGERVEAPAARWAAPGVRRRRAETAPVPLRRPAPAAVPVAAPVEIGTEPASSPPATEPVAEPEVAAATLHLPASLRAITRSFDRFRGRDEPAEVDRSMEPVEVERAVEPAAVPEDGTPPAPAVRGRFRPFDAPVAANGSTPANGHRPEPSAVNGNGHLNGSGNGAVDEPEQAIHLAEPLTLAGQDETNDEPAEAAEEELVAARSDRD
jgi:RNA polymerase subunit RPABC4/transcription elongation factor Spt4